MKKTTAVIFDFCGEQKTRFFTPNLDLRSFDGVYINAHDRSEELSDLTYKKDSGDLVDDLAENECSDLKELTKRIKELDLELVMIGFAP